MIDINKSVAIFCHPRSGSTWFQNSLNQFSLDELFNLYNRVVDYNDDGIKFNFIPGVTTVSYPDQAAYDKELHYRFEIFNYFESIKQTVSIKNHIYMLDSKMVTFLKSKKIQFVQLERINKYDTFWSFLIAWQINKWHYRDSKRDVTITKPSVLSAINLMNRIERSNDMVTQNFDTTKIYYEDLLTLENNHWFHSNKKYSKLDTKSHINILNLTEVNEWLDSEGYSQWKMNISN